MMYFIFTPGQDLSERYVFDAFNKWIHQRVEVYVEPSSDNPRLVTPLGTAEGSGDIKRIVAFLKDSFERELIAE